MSYNVEPKQTEIALRNHLKKHGLLSDGLQSWTVDHSSFGGRGLFATRDIETGELIFVDNAVLISPRYRETNVALCASCYKNDCPLFPCDRGCGLPVCSQACEDSKNHTEHDCEYLRKLEPTCGSTWSMGLLRALLGVQAISLDQEQRDLLAVLQCHNKLCYDAEVTLLRNNLKNSPKPEEIKFMMIVSGIFNTNSFETIIVHDKDHSTSLRGLYPMGALQNHSCVPNTRHHFDSQQRLYVVAVRSISAGEELTMTYIDLFWDTTLRRQVLSVTKYFSCRCKRCSDPTECESFLGALYCALDNCPGILLPHDPLDSKSPWTCNRCQTTLKSRQIHSIRSGLSSLLQENLSKSPRKILTFLQKELSILVPSTNYLMAETKYRIVSYFGKIEGLTWGDLSDNELAIKSSYCNDLLTILSSLGCGQCRKRGLILYELYCTTKEQLRRLQERHDFKEESLIPSKTMNLNDNERLLNEIKSIFQNDVVAATFLESNDQ